VSKEPRRTVGEIAISNGRTTRANCQRGRSIAVTHEGAIAPKDWRDLSVPKTQGRCRRTAEQRDELAASDLPAHSITSLGSSCLDGPNRHHPTKGTGAGNPAARAAPYLTPTLEAQELLNSVPCVFFKALRVWVVGVSANC